MRLNPYHQTAQLCTYLQQGGLVFPIAFSRLAWSVLVLMLTLSQVGQRLPPEWLPGPFGTWPPLFEWFLHFRHHKLLQLHLALSPPGISRVVRNPGSPGGEWYTDASLWVRTCSSQPGGCSCQALCGQSGGQGQETPLFTHTGTLQGRYVTHASHLQFSLILKAVHTHRYLSSQLSAPGSIFASSLSVSVTPFSAVQAWASLTLSTFARLLNGLICGPTTPTQDALRSPSLARLGALCLATFHTLGGSDSPLPLADDRVALLGSGAHTRPPLHWAALSPCPSLTVLWALLPRGHSPYRASGQAQVQTRVCLTRTPISLSLVL